jgi:hypothetical protein
VVEKIMGWRHSGFSVHSKVRAQTRKEADQGNLRFRGIRRIR